MRKVAVAVRIVGGEDDSVRANDSSRMCEPIFVGLARDEATLAPDIVAGFLRNAIGMMIRGDLSMTPPPISVMMPIIKLNGMPTIWI